MIQKLVPVIIFAAAAACIIQLINYSFTSTYKSIETSVKAPYAKAQRVYEQTAEAELSK